MNFDVFVTTFTMADKSEREISDGVETLTNMSNLSNMPRIKE